MIRLGLCCLFREEPIHFRITTVAALKPINRPGQLLKLEDIAFANAHALDQALRYCAAQDIGSFRVNSKIMPCKTHPEIGYTIDELPNADGVRAAFRACGRFARAHGIRLTFHPDQFVLPNARLPLLAERSLAELAYQNEVAALIGADVINIHGGGSYGNKKDALERLVPTIEKLPADLRSRLTLENDDRTFTPADLLPVCRATGTPLVYDVHHHRCNPDGQSIEAVTDAARTTWNREPLFHLSSPKAGYANKTDPRPHHDFIAPTDFPACWRGLPVTVEVEAKAKELAIARLKEQVVLN